MPRLKQPRYHTNPAHAAAAFAADYSYAQTHSQRDMFCKEYDAAVIWSRTISLGPQLTPRDQLRLSPSLSQSNTDGESSSHSSGSDSSDDEPLIVQHRRRHPPTPSTLTATDLNPRLSQPLDQKRMEARRKSAECMARLRAQRKLDAAQHEQYRDRHNEQAARYRSEHRAEIRRKQEQRRFLHVLFPSPLPATD